MPSADDRRSETSAGAWGGSAAKPADQPADQAQQDAARLGLPADRPPQRHEATQTSHTWRKRLFPVVAMVAFVFGGYRLVPIVKTMLDTISTDDAYINGHVTFLAPRVAGQVSRVLVDDNMRVERGDVLVQLDKEPYQVQLAIKQAAVEAAKADLTASQAQVRAIVGLVRAGRFQLERAMEDVNTKIANLRADVATFNSRKAALELARANLRRGQELQPSGGISKEELDVRSQTVKVSEANVDQSLQAVYADRVGLGLPAPPPEGHKLGDTPPELVETYSAVRQALGQLIQSAAQLGYSPVAFDVTPSQAVESFLKLDPEGKGNVEHIYAKLIPEAPAIKQAEAKLVQAQRDLAQAELDLRYCDVVSEIGGVVTRRNVNPGNNVQAGQSLMAVRSLTEIWIDANFKETQLADLRIGQRVRCEVDMYGRRREFEGRITGFTMGTGQTLALLPPQNATGNFVKIVQRLPVRIEMNDYEPEKAPLFVGLSVVPYVYYKEPATGPHAGEFLQPPQALPRGPTVTAAREDSPSAAPASTQAPSASGNQH
jgi:membrane fusion protein (multidrug efflux system)